MMFEETSSMPPTIEEECTPMVSFFCKRGLLRVLDDLFESYLCSGLWSIGGLPLLEAYFGIGYESVLLFYLSDDALSLLKEFESITELLLDYSLMNLSKSPSSKFFIMSSCRPGDDGAPPNSFSLSF